MKIQYEKWSGKESDILTIEQAFKHKNSWEYQGIAENALTGAEEANKRLGRLCEILQQKGLLSAQEILDIAGIYNHDCRFVDE